MIDVRTFTVGPLQENCHIVRADAQASGAVVVDPGEEPDRLADALRQLGIDTVEAILLTHCHFDHIGAVAPLAGITGAPVHCPELERPIMVDPMHFTPPGFGPFEGHEPEHTVAGGDRLSLAGLDLEVVFTPGHSPGHVTYALDAALISGDVLFAGSIGRTDLPGADHETLLRSIAALLERFDDDTVVYPGHMGNTTLGRERRTNPFLAEPARTGS